MNIVSCPWVFPAAFVLDLLTGDPRRLPHPIRLMGKAIESFETRFRKGRFSESTAGSLLAILLVLGTWIICTAAVRAAHVIHPLFAQVVHLVLIYYSLSTKSLKTEALKVYKDLNDKGLDEAKKQLSMIVGRDMVPLDETGVTRAAVETVAENLVDGVIAPLFYAALGGGPLAMAYKMVNTLDSMIGYKNERYKTFGRFAARLDDAANLIPARVSAVVISVAAPLVKLPFLSTIKTAARDGRKHSSPNAGISEAAFAGALGITLGGPNFYGGHLVEKPYIGRPIRPIVRKDIQTATSLMMASAFIWFFACWAATWALPQWLL